MIFQQTVLVSTELKQEGGETVKVQTAATAVSLVVSRCKNVRKPQPTYVPIVQILKPTKAAKVQVIYIWGSATNKQKLRLTFAHAQWKHFETT